MLPAVFAGLISGILGIVALGWTLAWTWRRRSGAFDLETIILAAAMLLAFVGITGTLLGAAGQLRPSPLGLVCLVLASAAYRLERARAAVAARPTTPRRRGHAIAIGSILIVAALLRWPPIDYGLAGRDQGTYALRAAATARSGRFDRIDPVLAASGPHLSTRSGPSDLFGLYTERTERWRAGRYEAAYRPGWYLADRRRGHVVPQFFHLHPTLGAVAHWFGGARGFSVLVLAEGLLGIAALLAIGRRLWPDDWAGYLPGCILAVSPLPIWVHRNTLSESVTQALTWAAVLALVRARDQELRNGGDPQTSAGSFEIMCAAFLVGGATWARGNGWVTAPAIVAVLWLLPSASRQRGQAPLLYLTMLLGSVAIHSSTVFPYLYDEFHRQFALWATPAPADLVLAATAGALLWWSFDELLLGPRGRWRKHPAVSLLRQIMPTLCGGAALVGIGMWWWWAHSSAATPPWSRLDALTPVLGWPMLALAGLGLARWARPVVTNPTTSTVWLFALAAGAAATLWLYAPRNLPRFGLYYYGRYLVPEIMPLVALGVTQAVAWCSSMVRPGLRRHSMQGSVGVLLLGWTVWPLLRHPEIRMADYDGTRELIDALEDAVPTDGIVIAGGEGWHHGHTFDLVGGALAMGRGRTVLPYATREAAYASLYELLVTGPHSTGATPPPVFLLINEATHAHSLRPSREILAAADDGLWPPFRARATWGLELQTDRVTARNDGLPTGVTRDQLRMFLVEVEVDPDREREAITWNIEGPPAEGIVHRPADPEHPSCLSSTHPTMIEFSPATAAKTAALVVVLAPGTGDASRNLRVDIDGQQRAIDPLGLAHRVRDTVGPWPVDHPPQRLTLFGSESGGTKACPQGELAQVRLLGPEHGALVDAPPTTLQIEPAEDWGHARRAATWVAGRGISRYRPRQGGDTSGLSMPLRPAEPITFAPEPVPAQGRRVLDVIVTFTRMQVHPDALLRLWAGTELVAEIDPPEHIDRTWQSPAAQWQPRSDRASWRIELVSASAEDEVWIRDIGLFARGQN